MSLGEVGFGTPESLMEFLEILLRRQGAVFPRPATGLEIAAMDLLFVEQAFASGRLDLPLVATADELGEEDARGREEVVGRRRFGRTIHVSISLPGCEEPILL